MVWRERRKGKHPGRGSHVTGTPPGFACSQAMHSLAWLGRQVPEQGWGGRRARCITAKHNHLCHGCQSKQNIQHQKLQQLTFYTIVKHCQGHQLLLFHSLGVLFCFVLFCFVLFCFVLFCFRRTEVGDKESGSDSVKPMAKIFTAVLVHGSLRCGSNSVDPGCDRPDSATPRWNYLCLCSALGVEMWQTRGRSCICPTHQGSWTPLMALVPHSSISPQIQPQRH